MSTTTALPAPPLPNSDLTAKFDAPSKTKSPDWTSAKVLTLDEMCDRYIQWMLNRCGGNRRAAARFLGIGLTSLYRYLKEADREKEIVQSGIDFEANQFRKPQDQFVSPT